MPEKGGITDIDKIANYIVYKSGDASATKALLKANNQDAFKSIDIDFKNPVNIRQLVPVLKQVRDCNKHRIAVNRMNKSFGANLKPIEAQVFAEAYNITKIQITFGEKDVKYMQLFMLNKIKIDDPEGFKESLKMFGKEK